MAQAIRSSPQQDEFRDPFEIISEDVEIGEAILPHKLSGEVQWLVRGQENTGVQVGVGLPFIVDDETASGHLDKIWRPPADLGIGRRACREGDGPGDDALRIVLFFPPQGEYEVGGGRRGGDSRFRHRGVIGDHIRRDSRIVRLLRRGAVPGNRDQYHAVCLESGCYKRSRRVVIKHGVSAGENGVAINGGGQRGGEIVAREIIHPDLLVDLVDPPGE